VSQETWAVWAAVLDRLEADVSLAEQLADDPTASSPEPWGAPAIDTPIPATLVDRAADILARQTCVQEAIAAAMSATSRQQDFASRVNRATRSPEPSVYVDVSA
jgi:hypothetical protein